MKKLLILSYYFPPLGMGGTQRAAKFTKYLPDFNWQPTVLTVKPIAYWAEDPDALDELSAAKIVRTESLDPQRLLLRLKGYKRSADSAGGGRLSFINQRILPFFLIPDSKILWRYHVLRMVKYLTRQEKYDAILTTSPPHSVHLIGAKLARRYRIPWLADFRDAWTDSVVVHEPTWIQKRLNKRLQAIVIKKATAVIGVTPGIVRRLLEYGAESNKVHLIPNGFDPQDYPKPNARRSHTFVLCHSGSITRFSYPDIFLTALADLRQRKPELLERLKVIFVGQDVTGDLKEMIDSLSLENTVTYVGYKPHRESMQYLADADALVLIARGNQNDTFIPGKTYEYLGSCKPILAITNVQDTRELLESWPLAFISGAKVGDIVDAIVKVMKMQRPEKETCDPQRYSRREQTKQLAEILESVS